MLGFLGYGGRSPHVTDACPTTTRKERSRRSAVTRLTGTTDPDGRDLSHTAAGGSWLLAHERVLHEVHAGQSPKSALCFGVLFALVSVASAWHFRGAKPGSFALQRGTHRCLSPCGAGPSVRRA